MGKPIGRFFVEVVAASVKAGASSRKLADSCVKRACRAAAVVRQSPAALPTL